MGPHVLNETHNQTVAQIQKVRGSKSLAMFVFTLFCEIHCVV